jgi:hypothetical protein
MRACVHTGCAHTIPSKPGSMLWWWLEVVLTVERLFVVVGVEQTHHLL